MFEKIYKYIFKLLGWKVVGSLSPQINKAIFIVAPHFTWFDFLLGLGSRANIGLPIKYLGKKELFDNIFYGWFFRFTGGQPVDRFSKNNAVDSVAEIFNNSEKLLLGMSPEGTRKNVQKLRTGFYYIALASNVPLIFVGLEFPAKTVIISEKPFYPTGNFESDLVQIRAFYKNIQGRKKDWVQ